MTEQNSLGPAPVRKLNITALAIGSVSAFGITLVANFQLSAALVVHLLGAFLVFAFAVVYSWMQVYITHKTIQAGTVTKMTLFYMRAALSFFMTTLGISYVATASAAQAKWSRHSGHKGHKLYWKEADPGFYEYLVSTFSQWMTAICLVLFFLTFFVEFKELDTSVKIFRAEDSRHDHNHDSYMNIDGQ